MMTYFVLGPEPSNVQQVVDMLKKSGATYASYEDTAETPQRDTIISKFVPDKGVWPNLEDIFAALDAKKINTKVFIVVSDWHYMCTRYQQLDHTLNPTTASELLQMSYRRIFDAVNKAADVEFEIINPATPAPPTPPVPEKREHKMPAIGVVTFSEKQEKRGGAGRAPAPRTYGPAPKGLLRPAGVPEKLVLTTYLAPGDIVMLTAAVRDLHRAYPNQFVTDVATSASQIWENNPLIKRLRWHKEKREVLNDKGKPETKDVVVADDADTKVIEMHYDKDYEASVSRSDQNAYHFIHGYTQHLENALGIRIPVTEFKGDIYISREEKSWMSQIEETGEKRPFWLIMAGGKFDFTTKWWPTENYQAVVDHFKDEILFVQAGEAAHWHPRLTGVVDLVGKTDLRQFIRLVYHSSGIVCPITMAMHLAAAVETKQNMPEKRPCVVIAGGREPTNWEAYPHHKFLHTLGSLPCCENKACWVSRCHKVGDGDEKDEEKNLCKRPVRVGDTDFPECMMLIEPGDVVRAIELYQNLWKVKADDRRR